ncbi:hypothetical protein PQR34_49200, partial [Paraburkholderia sediminicola]
SSASTDAVNGSQLYATNQSVQKNTGDITDINSSITGITNGTIGLVQQASSSAPITVGKSTGGSVVNVTGTAGLRTITGVAAGAL